MEPDLSEELASLVRRLYATELLRSADEAGGVRLSFISNNRLYQITTQTEVGRPSSRSRLGPRTLSWRPRRC